MASPRPWTGRASSQGTRHSQMTSPCCWCGGWPVADSQSAGQHFSISAIQPRNYFFLVAHAIWVRVRQAGGGWLTDGHNGPARLPREARTRQGCTGKVSTRRRPRIANPLPTTPPPPPHPGPPPCKGEGAEVYLRGEGTTCGREWEVDGGATRSDSAPVMPETG